MRILAALASTVVVAGCAESRGTGATTREGLEHTDTRRAARHDRALVVDVVDGDTIVVDLAGTRETVRLLGVDAPETKHPRRPVECHGHEAFELLRALLSPGSLVHVRRDVVARDHFGRLLLYVWRSDGVFVNRELVGRGAARVLTIAPNGAHHDEFVAAAFDAHRHRRGWWARCSGAASIASAP